MVLSRFRKAGTVVVVFVLLTPALNAQIETAGELFVDLDAADPSAGTATWVNSGTLGDFTIVGFPFVTEHAGATAVSFNDGVVGEAYQSAENAPAGLVGPDPTRSIEAWVFNPDVPNEETIVSWGRRGGPPGTNMSFNYGTNPDFGAVGHWGAPDIGWNGGGDLDTGDIPEAGQWHHLVYTYDGTTTRVYSDGELVNSEELGPGVIDTHAGTRITIASQINDDGVTLNTDLMGSLSIGRLRIHDDVLTLEQIQANFNLERDDFPVIAVAPVFLNAPDADFQFKGSPTYSFALQVDGFPPPLLRALDPPGATISEDGVFTYDIPDPQPGSFTVRVEAENIGGVAEASWIVTLRDLPGPDDIEVAGELFVDLDAADPSAGTGEWVHDGTMDPFQSVGAPLFEVIDGAPAVTFNLDPAIQDAYQSLENAPAGLVGPDATRSIEVWAFNTQIPGEETLVSWGRRGGGDGTNMSFNYGTNPLFGAVGHWGAPDLGWNGGGADNTGEVPEAGRWHHLVYTFDGTTTRVYSDGELVNFEELGPGTINTHADTRITLAAQLEPDGVTLNFALRGILSIGRVRIHDEALSPFQVLNNYLAEQASFETPDRAPEILGAPVDEDFHYSRKPIYLRSFSVTGFPDPVFEVVAPPGAEITEDGVLTFPLPDPEPASFDVTVRAVNRAGTAEESWVVSVIEPRPRGDIELAGELFVELDAGDLTAGGPVWLNSGTIADLQEVGDPILADVGGASAVSFNGTDVLDAYQCFENAPAGLVGPDATRSIEVWAFNEEIPGEETLVSWGRRGGPAGTNMSFNYGTDPNFGAVGHWGAPDIGWTGGGADNTGDVPEAGRWHHLVYTYDGTTTRVYDNGFEVNFEELGPGVIDTWPDTRITIAAQLEPDGVSLNMPLRGVLSIGRVRIHDEALTPEQVLRNFELEAPDFLSPQPPEFVGVPEADTYLAGTGAYTREISVRGFPRPVLTAEAPPGATIEDSVFVYPIPDPEPDSFEVVVRAANDSGTLDATWTVTRIPPEPLAVGPVHRYSFDGSAVDSAGGADGTVFGDVTFENGLAVLNNDGTQNSNENGVSPPADPPGAYIDLPNGIISALGNSATFETWVTWDGPTDSSWQRIFDFGTSVDGENASSGAPFQYYIFLTPRSGAATLRCGYRNGIALGSTEQLIETAPLSAGSEHHVVVVWDGDFAAARMYLDGRLVAEGGTHFQLSEMVNDNNWLGRSQWADPMFDGSYDEFRIYDYPLTGNQVLGNFLAGASTLNGLEEPGVDFVRGDADSSGGINLTDGVRTLNWLFIGGPEPECVDAADANDSGDVNLTDAVFTFNWLFTGGEDPPAPSPSQASYRAEDCGRDETTDSQGTDLGCLSPATLCE